MTFTADQNAALAAKLDPAVVKGRQQAGRNVSYVEGWHVIAEANRIFGFDGWQRHTLYCGEVSRVERGIGNPPKPGFKVGYEAKVRIIVGDIIRDGTGHGSGIATDLFDAIESAAKEAETDAMKRALITFGNPFGLALYDKTGASVGVDEEPVQRRQQPAAQAPARTATPLDKALTAMHQHSGSLLDLQSWYSAAVKERISRFSPADQDEFRRHYDHLIMTLELPADTVRAG